MTSFWKIPPLVPSRVSRRESIKGRLTPGKPKDDDMTSSNVRIQLLSDVGGIAALSRAAATRSIVTEPISLSMSDQRFGIVEAAAIVAIVKGSAEVVELLANAYNKLQDRKKITIKTPKGSVTIEGDNSISPKAIQERIDDADVF